MVITVNVVIYLLSGFYILWRVVSANVCDADYTSVINRELWWAGHSFPASAPGPASDHGCWTEYTTAVSSVSSTDSASYSGKKCCCYTRGHSFPASGPVPDHGCWAEYTTAVSSVSSTDSASHSGKKLCCYTQGTTSQPQPQTTVVGQSIPQQYPQSPAQTVPPTQVRNYVVILRALLPSPRPSLRPWLLGREYHSNILSLQHRQCLPLR